MFFFAFWCHNRVSKSTTNAVFFFLVISHLFIVVSGFLRSPRKAG
jgi:hypothetical protein